MRKGQKRPVYVACKGAATGKHTFERLKHNQFEKCMHCGEPRFALVDQSLSRPSGPLCNFLNAVL